MNDLENGRPAEGTKCRNCQCCFAGIYDETNGVRVPVCMACWEDRPCAGQRPAANKVAQPEAVKASETIQETTMAEVTMYACTGGCGELSEKPGFKWGHKNGCKRKAAGGGQAKKAAKPSTALAKVEPQIEIETPAEESRETVWLELNGGQVDRLLRALPLQDRVVGLQAALGDGE